MPYRPSKRVRQGESAKELWTLKLCCSTGNKLSLRRSHPYIQMGKRRLPLRCIASHLNGGLVARSIEVLNREIRSQVDKLRDRMWSGSRPTRLPAAWARSSRARSRRRRRSGFRSRAAFPRGRRLSRHARFRKNSDTGEGEDGCPYDLMRWSRFKNERP